jgi:hypothetical protein
MRAAFRIGDRSREILDLTAPASDEDGIVARWLRDALARDEAEAEPDPLTDKPAV